MQYLEWHTEQRQVKELVPLEKNPFGKITDEKRSQLEDKIRKLGLFEIPTIDVNNELLSFNKRRHILMALGRGEELIDVRVPNRKLTAEEREAVIVSSNIHEGEWDRAILESDFLHVDLDALGLDINLALAQENGEPDLEGDEIREVSEEEAAKYPIEARFSEKYDAFVIVTDNEVDANYVREVLDLPVTKSYKSSAIGKTHVVQGHKFIELIRKFKKQSNGNS